MKDESVPECEFVSLDGEDYIRISAVDWLPPFLMNLPTDTDLWMFISSTGGLTAGRRDPDGALFPYETVDRLHDAPCHTGPITLVRWQRRGSLPLVWEPLAPVEIVGRAVERSLSKNTLGNRLVFEEINHEAGLAFRYRWAGSDQTGWVRTATLTNLGRDPVVITLLDGLRNVLPSGAPLALYQRSSCLVDAYKRVDVDPESRLGIFSLTARISDRPEPAEELRATTVWCSGLPDFQVALSPDALRAFRRGDAVHGERVLTGRRGNYLVTSTLTLEPGARVEWHIAADTERSHVQIARLRARLRQPDGVRSWIEESLQAAADGLRRIVGSTDGIQLTGRADDSVHHFANVLFNDLRGGVFVENYSFPRADFAAFLRERNREVAVRHAGLVAALPDAPTVTDLHRAAETTGDADLRRLCFEYLPLYFGRRHGDPSRPWNRFSISARNPDGTQSLRYEGNWRDVFQNWEALLLGFPGFLPSVIAKFVNASTVDGFNPYRITRDGVDWEVPDAEDPWGGIGYWGDHQVIYLLKFLESLRRHAPRRLQELLAQEIFSYADVPYRLKPYAEVLANPRATILFDELQAASVAERVAATGDDGKLVRAADGIVYHASLLEKLIVPPLSKLSSFVADGGIWMNTERPEWNDANNALAGNGLSVVTLCYLRRYLQFVDELLAGTPGARAPVAVEVADWLRQVAGILERYRATLGAECVDDATRKRMMDELGVAFSSYRERVYANGFSAKTTLDADEVLAWCRSARDHVDHAIKANRRSDGLYHSYNLLEISADGVGAAVQRLGVMLEGQVAALSSGLVGPAEALDLLASLYASSLYRADQDSFLLYREKTLPTFLERNVIPEAKALGVPLVGELLAAGDTSIVERDADGVLRFHGDFSNASDIAAALDCLQQREPWTRSAVRDRRALIELFEEVFDHRRFTGRSGTMYAYEGLGSIYWHMVSKLLLAVQEVTLGAYRNGEDAAVCTALARYYYRIRGGLGFEKSVRDYGAFPTDPYSHTPRHAGAQQPGMTGQVKEEILTRFGELGVHVHDGIVGFDPLLLKRHEFLHEPDTYRFFDLGGAARSLDVPAGALAFSCCQVPVVYQLTPDQGWIRVITDDEVATEREGCRLDAADSRALLARQGGISRIEVGIPESGLFEG
ncbi:MAG: hypothetical protein MUO39_11620 [Steroidobacteraceae bacterium]|nr:hypothetical protein [Steroidobacteraceae bacterium]